MSTATEKLRRSRGQCILCGGPPVPGMSRCEECAERQRARVKAWRAGRKAQGKCIDCGAPSDMVRCLGCAPVRTPSAHTKRMKAQRARRLRERMQARAQRADALLAAQALALVEAKKPRPRQLSFRFTKKKLVQRFGVDFLIRRRHARGLDDFKPRDATFLPGSPEHRTEQRKRSARVASAYRELGITESTVVVTPDWIAEDKRDEAEMFNWMHLSARLR